MVEVRRAAETPLLLFRTTFGSSLPCRMQNQRVRFDVLKLKHAITRVDA